MLELVDANVSDHPVPATVALGPNNREPTIVVPESEHVGKFVAKAFDSVGLVQPDRRDVALRLRREES